jgi:PEP-CTERM motif
VLSGVNLGAAEFNYGGTSSVHLPEPSSMAIAGLGALGMIG